jgi:hypothetical protein
MIDDYSIEIALQSDLNDPPEGASETWVSDDFEQIKGWIRRKPIHGMKDWEWRFFTMVQGKLCYFLYESDVTPAGVFNFKQLTGTIETIGTKKFILEFHSCHHQFFYKTRSKEERQKWLTCVSINLNLYSPRDQILNSIASKENFWKIEKISNLKFLCTANTADLMLFQAKNVGARIQRKIAGSQFDHVAMILCHASGKVSIFEATNQDGVALVDWDQFFELNWLDLYSQVVYRKVEFERTDTMLMDLQKFINETKGKKFAFNAKKMIIKNNKKAGQEEDFFCSELVASAFKAMGLLPFELDPSKIWPVNFEKDDGLPLINAKMGPLVEIDFDLVSMEGDR